MRQLPVCLNGFRFGHLQPAGWTLIGGRENVKPLSLLGISLALGAAAGGQQAFAQMPPPGAAPHYFSVPNYANSPLPVVAGTTVTGGIRKFVDGLPGLGAANANNLGQYIPVAVPDTTTYPGTDYYEIAVVQYLEKMHSDLPPTKLRGYVQLATPVYAGNWVPLVNTDGSPILLPNGSQAAGVEGPHYLGPLIAATKDRPVRILFRNLLPTGVAGNLFIPVDTTVMGSGMGPELAGIPEPDPLNPMCGMLPKPAGCFAENRATLHLHGGHHAVDQRRHAAPVDHPGWREHLVPEGRQRQQRAGHARPGPRRARPSTTRTSRARG